jgi:hypothetical protein
MGEVFTAEMKAVVAELAQIAEEGQASPRNSLECGRTWRYLGDALFDLARGKDAALLAMGARAYRHAEGLLEGTGDHVEQAKLDFNYANTLRGLGAGTDRILMEQAKAHYQRALVTFEKELPQHVSQVKQLLASLEAQLALLGLHDKAASKVDTLKDIEQTLTRGGAGITAESEKEARKQLKAFRQEGHGLPAVRREAEHILDTLKSVASQAPAPGQTLDPNRLDEMKHQVEASTASSAGGEAAMLRHLALLLRDRYRTEVGAGKVTVPRQRALEPLLNELEYLLDHDPEEAGEIMGWLGKLRELMARITPFLEKPSYENPPPAGSRAARMLAVLGRLDTFIAGELARFNLSASEKRTGTDLFTRLTTAEGDLCALDDPDTEASALEREVLRQLALDVQAYALRHHLMLASPVWPAPAVPRDPNLVFFSGGGRARTLVETACRSRDLSVADRTSGRSIEQARWDDLRKACIAIFDLAVEGGPALAQVCFELGVARALGRASVILAEAGKLLPFDVDLDPCWLREAEGQTVVGEAIDAALYAAPHHESDSSVSATIAFAKREFGQGNSPFEVGHTLKLLDDAAEDPIEVRRLLETLQGYLGPGAPQLLMPSWPGFYPETRLKRCFHVMPFGPRWARDVMRIAKRACDSAGVKYIRGDQVADPRIIRSIWDEICGATHVLVDLTDFNANVAFELGIALTLGKKTLVVGQGDTVEHLFPSVAKLRVHPYKVGVGLANLHDLIARHVQR